MKCDPTPVRDYPVATFFASSLMLNAALENIQQGHRSFSSAKPLIFSRLDRPRGGLFVLDGHHRLVEAILDGQKTIAARVHPNVRWVERTSGFYADHLSTKVNVYDWVMNRAL